MAHAAERGLVWIRHWRGAVSCVVCQIRIAGICIFRFFRASTLCKYRTKAVFGLELMVGVSSKGCLTRVGSGRIVDMRIGA